MNNLGQRLWLLSFLALALTCQDVAARGGGRGGHGGGHGGHTAHSRPSGHGAFHPGRFTGGFVAPFFWGAYPLYPYYYPLAYPPAGVVTTPPVPLTVDPQVPLVSTETPQTGYWYYCPASQTYFPYAQRCAEPWQQVAPQPSQPSASQPVPQATPMPATPSQAPENTTQ